RAHAHPRSPPRQHPRRGAPPLPRGRRDAPLRRGRRRRRLRHAGRGPRRLLARRGSRGAAARLLPPPRRPRDPAEGTLMSRLILFSIPAFFLTMAIEALYLRWARRDASARARLRGYEARDTRTSLLMGIANVIISSVTKLGLVAIWAY